MHTFVCILIGINVSDFERGILNVNVSVLDRFILLTDDSQRMFLFKLHFYISTQTYIQMSNE